MHYEAAPATKPATPADGADATWRHHNVGRLLSAALRSFEARVLELMHQAGHPPLVARHINVTRHLDIEGTRLTELAQRAAMTKQSMSELVDQLESIDIVARRPDPTDARARIIYFTPVGLAWLDAFRRAVAQAEAEMADVVGADTLDVLKDDLHRYCRGSNDGLGRD